MPQNDGRQYVIGKGRAYFDKMVPGTKTLTGELFFGNAPEVNDSRDNETLDHFSSTEGLNFKDESIVLEQNQTITITVDNIAIENVALWYAGDLEKQTVTAATGVSETFKVLRGRTYQLGRTDDNVAGVRRVTNVVVTKGAVDPEDPDVNVPLANNVDVDLPLGRMYIELDAPEIPDDTEITVTYDVEAHTQDIIIAKGDRVSGAFRWISNNPHGPQKDHYYPYVHLTANGDYSLVNTEWQTMSFTLEVLKLNSNTPLAVISGRSIG